MGFFEIVRKPFAATEDSAATAGEGRKREAMEDPRRSLKNERCFMVRLSCEGIEAKAWHRSIQQGLAEKQDVLIDSSIVMPWQSSKMQVTALVRRNRGGDRLTIMLDPMEEHSGLKTMPKKCGMATT